MEAPTYFNYEEFLRKYPDFSQEMILADQGKYRELGDFLLTASEKVTELPNQEYAKYIALRAYVNAVLQDNTDAHSLEKAISLAKMTIGSSDTAPNIRAYAVSVFDALLTQYTSRAVKDTIMDDPYFSRFSSGRSQRMDYITFRRSFLRFGNNLSRMTEIKYKLVAINAEGLLFQKNLAIENNPQVTNLRKKVLDGLAEAEVSLTKDLAGEMPFKNEGYLVMPLFYKAEALTFYKKATGETPLGDPGEVYRLSLEKSREQKSNSSFQKFMEQRYSAYLSETN